jgi:ribonucleoside-diphosphate reductase alpha chain
MKHDLSSPQERTESYFAVSDNFPLREQILSENAIRVLERRYLKKDQRGVAVETPEGMFRRVASNVASADLRYDPRADVKKTEERFCRLISSLQFLPNSPTLMNAGNELQQLSACFVLPVDDSMDSIFEAVKNTALIHKSGGGTGFSFSRIRPRNDVVQSTKGVSSGPLSFMKVFDMATETVKQGGTRRGANMAILRVDHPDIIDFIMAKENDHVFNNFNLSVAITEKFMAAVQRGEEYDLINPRSGKVVGHKMAREVFNLMVNMAWKNGDPGIIFLDRINKDNPTPDLGKIESTNPCGEQPLLPYESCNLGSIDLGKMIIMQNGGPSIDYESLKEVVWTSVHFLDNVIDVNRYPLSKIEEVTRGNRKIGLGVMGFADMLIQLGISYDSEEALEAAEKVMGFIGKESKAASARLAEARGPFPNYHMSVYNENGSHPLRNSTTTTIAPTSTLSSIANCCSGVEPLFALSFVRKVMDNDELLEVNPFFEHTARENGFYSRELMERISEEGSIQEIPGIPEHVKRVFVTSHDIAPEWHIRMQAAFQKYTDNAVSKTINFPNQATTDDISKAFMMAYREGCKGLTIYRDGSRELQVLNKGAGSPAIEKAKLVPRPRPSVTLGKTERRSTGCGNLYVTINEDEQGLFEVFARMGKSGGCIASHSEAIGRLVSLALRAGVDTESITQQLTGIRCPSPIFDKDGTILSCPDAIGLALKNYLSGQNGEEVSKTLVPGKTKLADLCPECPECGSMIELADGCIVCRSCGYSKCG